jgi:hypothetical protein
MKNIEYQTALCHRWTFLSDLKHMKQSQSRSSRLLKTYTCAWYKILKLLIHTVRINFTTYEEQAFYPKIAMNEVKTPQNSTE